MHGSQDVPAIDVKALKERRDKKKPHFLLDVREPDEYEAAKIDGSVLIPLGELQARVGEVPKDREVIVHCHHGGRSAQAVRFLLQAGVQDAKNLDGGIDAWSCEIDKSVPRY
ncbi:MAG: rhodanese [Elusimicrobia bacterium]|nr:rhodanese [Elusimicrobiota bacterium]